MEDQLFRVGIQLLAASDAPQLFMIYLNCDRPLLVEERPMAALCAEDLSDALHITTCGARDVKWSDERLNVFHFHRLIDDINDSCSPLPDYNTINCINLLLDLALYAKYPIPDTLLNTLGEFADDITLNLDHNGFFESSTITRSEIVTIITSIIGSVALNMYFFLPRRS